MSAKRCLITGATSGIGRATAGKLAAAGYELILIGRDQEKLNETISGLTAATGNAKISGFKADLSSMRAVWKLSIAIHRAYNSIDVLINNAGGVHAKRGLTEDKFEKTFATNHLSYFLLTNLLLDLLKNSPGARIVNVSSNSHFSARFDPFNLHGESRYSTFGAYASSKLCNVLFTYELARRLEGTGITANCLHPGVVRTKIGNKDTNRLISLGWNAVTALKGISEEKGAETPFYLATSGEVAGVTGKYFYKCREQLSSKSSYDTDAARKLWEDSEKMTGLK